MDGDTEDDFPRYAEKHPQEDSYGAVRQAGVALLFNALESQFVAPLSAQKGGRGGKKQI